MCCLYTGNTNGLVLHANIMVKLGDTTQDKDRSTAIPFQSNRFTRLFLNNSTRNASPKESQQTEDIFGTKIYDTIEIVNNNGG